MKLEGKVALVAGAGGALGRAIAEELAESGARTAPLACDFADPKAVEAAVVEAMAALGQIDILVDVASPADGEGPAVAQLPGHLALARAVVKHMEGRGYGKLVFVAPVPGARGPAPATGAATGALIGLTRALARELAPRGVTVNCVCPGPMDSMAQGAPEEAKALAARTPMRRLARPEDVAAAVAFLASDAAAYVTGIALGVDGGAAN